MGFFRFIRVIGDRIGILETVCKPGSKNVTVIRTRTVTLSELEVEVRSPEVRALAESPSEVAVPLEKIFETAGIAPNPLGWSVDKLKELIQSEPFKGKPKGEIQKSVLEAMNSAGVTAGDIVKDAVARDRALDAYEESGGNRIRERVAACKKRQEEIESGIEKLHRESAALKETMQAEEQRWQEWRRKKRAYEKDLAATIGYIVDKPSITTDDDV